MRKQYVITDGAKFVRQDMSGKYNLVSNSAIADFWDSAKVAESILQNSLPKYVSTKYYVAYWENGKFINE